MNDSARSISFVIAQPRGFVPPVRLDVFGHGRMAADAANVLNPTVDRALAGDATFTAAGAATALVRIGPLPRERCLDCFLCARI